jgi:hypothetical protein
VSEALRAVAVLVEPPCPEHAAIARALALPAPPPADEHTDALVFQVYPYASVYLGGEGMLGGEARDRVAGFWRALGGEPPDEPDHVAVLLAALATLDAPDPRMRAARRVLYAEHVASWMPPFLAALRRVGSAYYVAWAELVGELLATEAPAPGLPVHLRAAPPLARPTDLDELMRLVLAPLRAGGLVVRDDLARCADALALALRAGERRFALRALLAQDAAGVLGWLAGELRAQAACYAGDGDAINAWWRARASATADLLDALARDAGP